MKNLQADVVVVAAGLSGLAASIAAAEQGLSVITLEKSKTTGGAASMGMGPLAIGTRHMANELYEYICEECKKSVPVVEKGVFGAHMHVSLLNDGPFTIILDSRDL